MIKIEKKSAVPLYVQLENYFFEQIEKGELAAGERIGTEKEICKNFKLSRITTRKALGNLVAKGLLESVPGRGTFVKAVHPVRLRKSILQIGVFIYSRALRNKDFFSDIIRGILEPLNNSACNTIMIPFEESSEDVNSIAGCQGLIAKKNLDGGLILSEEMNDAVLINLSQNAFPLVTVHRYTPVPLIPCVHVSYENSLLASVEYLAGLGHSRIAYITGTPRIANLEQSKLRGFKLGLKKHNLFYDDSYILDESAFDMAALERLMKTSPRPSAIIAPHDLLGRDIILMLRQIGFKVPNDVSVMGHNDLEAVSFFEPGITTMRIPRLEMGRAAVATLLKTIEKEKTESTYFDCELLIRSSCAPFQKKGKR